MDNVACCFSAFPADWGGYQIGALVDAINNPSGNQLQDVAFTPVALGSGNYQLSFTPPAGSTSLRIKWSPLIIAPSSGLLNFDVMSNSFGIDPATHDTWFGANNVSEPAPTPSQLQTVTIATGVSGLSTPNFSVKAYGQINSVGGNQPQNLALSSGNNQTGTQGQPLANPLTVKVTDGSGNPISGTSVTFSVTAGGGSLSVAQVVTNAQGLAASTLTLGPVAGSNTVTASSGTLGGSPVVFTAIGQIPQQNPAATLSAISGNSQAGAVGKTLAAPLVVKVTDVNGNPISGVTVTFRVTGGSGSLNTTQVNTDAGGLASAQFTLGATTGVSSVTASSGTLAGSPITFTATARAAAAASVNWTEQTPTTGWPGYNGWFTVWYDQLSGTSIFYGKLTNSLSIYSTDLFSYSSSTNTFTHIGGTGSLVDACPADTLTQPGDRHPGWQMAVDTKRNFLWLYGGVNQLCNAGTSPDTNPHQDMYYLKLNADPTKDVWQQAPAAHIPSANAAAAMVYDPDDDVLFAFGNSYNHNHWVYCRTAENGQPGSLTAKQAAAGCATPDDWSEVSSTGGIQPAGVTFPGLIYDPVTHKVIAYGGMDGTLSISYNQIWAYDVPSKTWTQKALNTTPPPLYKGSFTAQPAMVYDSITKKIIFHQTSNTGAPADWQYDSSADTWTLLTSSGSGAATDAVMVFDAGANKLISWSLNPLTYLPDVWQGDLSATTVAAPPRNACDLNGDGVVDATDVQLAINQTLGLTSCTNASLGDPTGCTVVDVQKVINASLGQGCK
jgi:hypothetical protein